MKNVILVAAVISLIVMAVVPAVAGRSGQAGKSKIAHVDLYPQDGDPSGPADPAVAEMYADASGRIKYNLEGDLEIVFNGHQLVAGKTYQLYSGGNALGDAVVANGGGNVHIEASLAGTTAADLGGYINLWVMDGATKLYRVARGEAVK